MIKTDGNAILVRGELTAIMEECTTILRTVYSMMVDTVGEENANSYLIMIGKLAVMAEEELENEGFQGKI